MDEIKINPNGGKISILIEFKSLHVVSYAYRIFNTEETEVFQKETGTSRESQTKNTRELDQAANFYLHKKLRISLDLVDPNGSGNNYQISISIIQDQTICGTIDLNGETTDNDTYIVRWRKFII